MRSIACVVVVFVTGALSRAGELQIPLTVEEPVGVARKSAPASGGIPLPKGRFRKGQPFAVFHKGAEIPSQVSPLVVDGKGFLRWILVDFQTDLGAREKKEFILKARAPAAKPATALKVVDDAGALTVDTGKIRFVISKSKPFSLFTTVEAGGKPVVSGGEVSYTHDWDGKRHIGGKPSSVEIQDSGPMRVTIKVVGRFVGDDDAKLRYIARITAWAGRSDVHVKYSLANSNPDNYIYRRIRYYDIVLKTAGKPRGALIGASKPLSADGDGWLQQGLLSGYQGAARAGSGDGETWKSAGGRDKALGWIAAKTGGGTLYACDLFFSDDPPRRLEVKGGKLVLWGTTPRFEPVKDSRGRLRGAPMSAKTRWLHDCSHLSSFYILDFAAPADGAKLGARARSDRNRLHLRAPLDWYSVTESLAVGKFGTQADEMKCYDAWKWAYEAGRAPRAPSPRYKRGLRHIRYEDNHYETEEDIVESLLLMYLRTGSRAYFDYCRAWANYEMDLQKFRSDGWRWKDGGVWWRSKSGPLGNLPRRGKDPVTGFRNEYPQPWSKKFKEPLTPGDARDLFELGKSKQCYCHNYGAGLAGWYCITGDRDALEAAVDGVEQNIETQRRAFGREPGKPGKAFGRDFTRSCYSVNGTRLAAPTDPFVIEASDWLTRVYLQRPAREPRGLVKGSHKLRMSKKYHGAFPGFKHYVGEQGLARMRELGVTFDEIDGQLSDPKTGAKWYAVLSPHTWVFPPLSGAMECYYRQTDNEDAHDWVVAFGQSAAHVLYQKKHNLLAYGRMLVDFPVKGVCKDYASWVLPDEAKWGEGLKMSGYLATFWPDVAARGYSLTGEPLLKQRAYDYWNSGSHRGYRSTKMHNLGKVNLWVNYYGVHSEQVLFTGRTFYEHSHPRKDGKPPKPVTDLTVTVKGAKATVTFTAPADQGGGRVLRYQVKCSDKPLVDYVSFLGHWKANTDGEVTNWWMAANLTAEPKPKAPGARETFTVTGMPKGARYFAVRAYDDSSNRSAMSNVAEAGK